MPGGSRHHFNHLVNLRCRCWLQALARKYNLSTPKGQSQDDWGGGYPVLYIHNSTCTSDGAFAGFGSRLWRGFERVKGTKDSCSNPLLLEVQITLPCIVSIGGETLSFSIPNFFSHTSSGAYCTIQLARAQSEQFLFLVCNLYLSSSPQGF